MKNNSQALEKYGQYLNQWLNDNLASSHKTGYVIGLSGGIDSAVALALCLNYRKINAYPIFINIGNTELDRHCVQVLAAQYQINIPELNLEKYHKDLVKELNITDRFTINNLKPRLRMSCLYALAQEKNMLVMGTSNADELYLGYFTKYGDGAADASPIANLTKKEIYELAKILHVPQCIIDRAPSASLYEEQTDEQELGIKYEDLDNYLLGHKINPNTQQKIERWHNNTKHKKVLLNKPKPFSKLIDD